MVSVERLGSRARNHCAVEQLHLVRSDVLTRNGGAIGLQSRAGGVFNRRIVPWLERIGSSVAVVYRAWAAHPPARIAMDRVTRLCRHRTDQNASETREPYRQKKSIFDGVCDLSALSRRERGLLFAQIDVGEVWGVGRRVGARLLAAGIDNVQALRMAPPKRIRAEFGVVMERTVNELGGIACLALEDIAPAKKEMVVSRSFGQMVDTLDELAESVTLYASRAAEKLRAQQAIAGVVQVFVMTNRFRETEAQYSNAIAVPLIAPSSDTRVLTQAALPGLQRIFRSGYRYKKAGVMLMELSPSTYFQGSLFDAPGDAVKVAQSTRIMQTLDSINDRFGRASLFLGSAGVETRWTARSDNRSPRYTTQWDELPRTTN